VWEWAVHQRNRIFIFYCVFEAVSRSQNARAWSVLTSKKLGVGCRNGKFLFTVCVPAVIGGPITAGAHTVKRQHNKNKKDKSRLPWVLVLGGIRRGGSRDAIRWLKMRLGARGKLRAPEPPRVTRSQPEPIRTVKPAEHYLFSIFLQLSRLNPSFIFFGGLAVTGGNGSTRSCGLKTCFRRFDRVPMGPMSSRFVKFFRHTIWEKNLNKNKNWGNDFGNKRSFFKKNFLF